MRHHNANMNQAAREWVHTQQECNRMAALLGNTRCLKIPYEALCLEPEATLSTIYRFLNLPPKSRSISSRIKHILGNQMRLGSLQEIRLDEKWKKALTHNDIQIFMNLAGELNNLHGYK